jgi:hypothetical protein
MARLLLLLFIVYPGVSVGIFGIFSCTTLSSGVAFLNADLTVRCFTRKHLGYMAAGVIWVFVFTVGIPVYFIYLLYEYHVPLLADTYRRNAELFEAIKLAALHGLPLLRDGELPPSVDSVSDVQLGALIALLVQSSSVEHALQILSGQAGLPDVRNPDDYNEAAVKKLPLRRRLAKTIKFLARGAARRMSSHLFSKAPPLSLDEQKVIDDAKRHSLLLTCLLRWCHTSGKVGVPVLRWSERAEDEEGEEEKHRNQETRLGAAYDLKHAPTKRRLAKAWAAAHLRELENRARHKVGFLFVQYSPSCWYWEVVELLRKLMLTSILALIAPGSAGQVVSGLLLALFALLANISFQPWEARVMNQLNQMVQLNLVLLMLTALILKVDLDGQGDSYFFTGIVAFLTLSPIALPVGMQLLAMFDESNAGDEVGEVMRDSALY